MLIGVSPGCVTPTRGSRSPTAPVHTWFLACAKREWPEAPPNSLTQLLKSLHGFPLKQQLEILVSQDAVQIIPMENQVFTSEELTHHEAILRIAREIQTFLNQRIPFYSGVVIIPVLRWWRSLCDLEHPHVISLEY